MEVRVVILPFTDCLKNYDSEENVSTSQGSKMAKIIIMNSLEESD